MTRMEKRGFGLAALAVLYAAGAAYAHFAASTFFWWTSGGCDSNCAIEDARAAASLRVFDEWLLGIFALILIAGTYWVRGARTRVEN